jgi:23S rRNA pseudouridine2605 synthase
MKRNTKYKDRGKNEKDSRKPGRKFYPKNDKNDAKPGMQNPLIRLNKYLADAGICSRREADRLIESGVVQINGKIVTQLGTKVGPDDKVQYGGQTLKREKLRYILLNKPKDFITTSNDPFDRKTVMALVEKACTERIYPVGRLDRNTLGLLLFTNDGEIAKKLTHPKHRVKKIYHAFLDKALSKVDMIKLLAGVELEDGIIQPDKIAYVEGENDKKQIGLELHSGRNRIVRRMFEHLGYKVIKLDRVFFAGLTKKDLPRGKWRHLAEKEVNILKRIS